VIRLQKYQNKSKKCVLLQGHNERSSLRSPTPAMFLGIFFHGQHLAITCKYISDTFVKKSTFANSTPTALLFDNPTFLLAFWVFFKYFQRIMLLQEAFFGGMVRYLILIQSCRHMYHCDRRLSLYIIHVTVSDNIMAYYCKIIKRNKKCEK
jgi:hypothetical protein